MVVLIVEASVCLQADYAIRPYGGVSSNTQDKKEAVRRQPLRAVSRGFVYGSFMMLCGVIRRRSERGRRELRDPC